MISHINWNPVEKRVQAFLILSVSALFGCATPGIDFKFAPNNSIICDKHIDRPLFIEKGIDSRVETEKRPTWTKPVEQLVANALANKLAHANLYGKIINNIEATSPPTSDIIGDGIEISFDIIKFQAFEDVPTSHYVRAGLLGIFMLPGIIAAGSLPEKFVSEIQIDFNVTDLPSRKNIMHKGYHNTQFLEHSEIGSRDVVLAQTGSVLETIIGDFISDLCKANSQSTVNTISNK